MAQIREIKRRIKSINNTAKVTHAMELVSAAKMRKSQQAALSSRPYTNTLNEVLLEVRTKTRESAHTLLMEKEAQASLIIIITTDRGLVGGLNMNLFREIGRSKESTSSDNQIARRPENLKTQYKFVVVGKKGLNFSSKTGGDILASFESDQEEPLSLARTLTKISIDSYASSQVNSVKILYPHFNSTVSQVPTISQILPIELEAIGQSGNQDIGKPDNLTTRQPDDLLFEPSPDQILENILPHYVLTKIYQALLDSKASEHSARMVAMKNATDAASDLVEDLTLTYNQVRQEAITKELLDIVTAQSAFE